MSWILKWPGEDYPYLTAVGNGSQWAKDQRSAKRFPTLESARYGRRLCGREQRKLIKIVRLKPTSMARIMRAWDRQLEANNNAIAAIIETVRALTEMVMNLRTTHPLPRKDKHG